eukprot:358354-Chlamydomonas_euryale.AAC.1
MRRHGGVLPEAESTGHRMALEDARHVQRQERRALPAVARQVARSKQIERVAACKWSVSQHAAVKMQPDKKLCRPMQRRRRRHCCNLKSFLPLLPLFTLLPLPTLSTASSRKLSHLRQAPHAQIPTPTR